MAERTVRVTDEISGLFACIIIDDTTLGPAAGGVRTREYPSPEAAETDARALARAMTIKCALAGLDAGGGKAVVRAHPGLDRPRAFERLGRAVEALGGTFRTAGDLGTTAADLAAMARVTEYVHPQQADLASALGRGYLACARAVASILGARVADLTFAFQGCGATGSAAARAVAAAGARVLVADLDEPRARTLAGELGATVVPAGDLLRTRCDVLAPCAAGGAVTEDTAGAIRARAVCGTANNICATPAAEATLTGRGIVFVPDVLSSAGAVIEGIGAMVMRLRDRGPLLDALETTTRALLTESQQTGRRPNEIAEERARQRIQRARIDLL